MDANRFARGKLYKITSPNTDRIYIGSTTEPTLAKRMAKHRANYKFWQGGKGFFVTSFQLLEHGDCSICLIETFPCNSKDELTAREQFHIDANAAICVNKQKAWTALTEKEYMTQYYEANREEIKQRAVQYRAANRDEIKQYKAQYYEANRDEIKQQHAQYREANREKIKQYMAQYHATNRETILDKKKQKHQCTCEGQYTTTTNKVRHLRGKKHQDYLTKKQELIARLDAIYGVEDWSTATLEEMQEHLEC